MNVSHSESRRTGRRALILPAAALAAVIVSLAAPARAATITFNPLGGGAGAGAISGVSGFGYATSSTLVQGIGTPTVGATFNTFYESVINATTGTPSTIGSNYSINASTNQFTVIAGFRESITQIVDGTVFFTNASGPGFSTGTTSPNFFVILATPAGTVNPSTGDGAGFGAGTPILTGHITSDNFDGSFSPTLSGGSPVIGSFNTSGLPTAITTANSVFGGGESQITVSVDTFNTSYFPTNPFALIFSTTNSLPFAAVAPLSGFYSGPGASPDVTFPGTPPTGFDPGTINAFNGNSLMFQTVATSSFSVPEPSSITSAVTASTVIPMFLCFLRRRSRKAVA
jgi:hypothetical protein